MEDQLYRAHAEALFVAPAPPPPPEESVFYNARTKSVNLGDTTDQSEMGQYTAQDTENETSGAEGTLDETSRYNTVLLKDSAKKRHCCSWCPSYRTADPDTTITPFAVILLNVLFVIYILNQADRLVLPVAIPSGLRCEVSIKNECRNLTHLESDNLPLSQYLTDIEITNLSNGSNSTEDCIHFSDYEQGLLTGPAFTVIYVVAGLPLARLADTRSRPFVLLLGLVMWSGMIFLTGFTVVFWQLLTLRVFLGIGEAACNPVAYSLMADFFPARHRAFVFSIYHYGVYVGGALGWMIAYVNEVLSWRWTFIILGICGFAVTPLAVVALWEPKTVREKRMGRRSGKTSYSILEVVVSLAKSPPYWLLLVAGSIRNIPGYALGAWLPTFFVRWYGVDPSHFSIKVGFVVLFGGGLGSFLGGFISDRLSIRWKNAKAYVIACGQILAVPCIIGVLLAPNPTMSYGLLFLAYVTAETWLGPAAAIVQDMCMPAMRAQASAIYIGVITIVASLGPIIIPGIMTHASFLDPCTNGVGYSLLIIVPSFYLLSAVLFVCLGLVMVYWDRRTVAKEFVYEEVKNNEREVPPL